MLLLSVNFKVEIDLRNRKSFDPQYSNTLPAQNKIKLWKFDQKKLQNRKTFLRQNFRFQFVCRICKPASKLKQTISNNAVTASFVLQHHIREEIFTDKIFTISSRFEPWIDTFPLFIFVYIIFISILCLYFLTFPIHSFSLTRKCS